MPSSLPRRAPSSQSRVPALTNVFIMDLQRMKKPLLVLAVLLAAGACFLDRRYQRIEAAELRSRRTAELAELAGQLLETTAQSAAFEAELAAWRTNRKSPASPG